MKPKRERRRRHVQSSGIPTSATEHVPSLLKASSVPTHTPFLTEAQSWDTNKEPVRKEKSLRHFHVTTAVAQPSSCSVAHVYMLACSKQKAASSCTFNTNSCTVNTKKEACLHRSGLFKWIIT